MEQTRNQQILEKLPSVGEAFYENRLAHGKELFPDLGDKDLDVYLNENSKPFDVIFMAGIGYDQDGKGITANASFSGTGSDFITLFLQIFDQIPEFHELLNIACEEFKTKNKINEN
jgi:hypothetical protein